MYLKLKPEKCHLLTALKSKVDIEIFGYLIKSKNKTELLVSNTRPSRRNFDFQSQKFCKKISKMCFLLSRLHMKWIWMLHSRSMIMTQWNSRMSFSRRLGYDDSQNVLFEELLVRKSVMKKITKFLLQKLLDETKAFQKKRFQNCSIS